MYVNGKPRPIGYLSDLRLLEQYRNVGLVARGYKYLRDLHTDGRAHLYLTTIAEGNDRAISILASSRAGLPIYQFTGSYHTVAIPLTRRPGRHVRDTSAIEVRPATDSDLGALLQFFEQVGPTRQFFPKYEAQDFSNSHGTFRGLRFSDLLLAFRGGRLVGTLGGLGPASVPSDRGRRVSFTSAVDSIDLQLLGKGSWPAEIAQAGSALSLPDRGPAHGRR